MVREALQGGGERATRFKRGMVDGVHYLELVEPIKQLKREGRLEEALAFATKPLRPPKETRRATCQHPGTQSRPPSSTGSSARGQRRLLCSLGGWTAARKSTGQAAASANGLRSTRRSDARRLVRSAAMESAAKNVTIAP